MNVMFVMISNIGSCEILEFMSGEGEDEEKYKKF